MIPDLSLQSAGDPRAAWDAYFEKYVPTPSAVRKRILALHEAGKHDHVIAAIESAIVAGQSQPWMYEVLALSMRIAGRDTAEIERVLLSPVDFTTGDVPDMIVVAAYLTRFQAFDAALRLYRQASRLAPTRPEPYVLGLKLARRQKDHEAIAWAATGILTYAWTDGHEVLHDQAEDAVTDAKRDLIALGMNEEAVKLEAAMIEARKRDLTLRVTWSGPGDLDLIVEEPAGTICSFELPHSPGGGALVHDGFGPNQSNCYEEYVCALGMPGKYTVRVRHALGQIVGKRARLEIIRYQGTSRETTRVLTVPVGRQDALVRINLTHGRRTELSKVQESTARRPMPRRRGSLLQMVGGLDANARRSARQFSQSRRQAELTQPYTAQGVGFQPVITVLSEGVTMSAMAVISGDRRYVRITTVPAFTAITDVFTFSFVNTGNPTGNPGLGGGNQGGNPGGGGNQGGGIGPGN